jgi:hypothetical protein
MAIAYNVVRRLPDTGKTIVDITLDGSYAAGGYALDPGSLGMELAPDMVDPQIITGQGFTPQWNQSTGKLQFFKNAAGAGAFTECVNTDLSTAVKCRCEVTGYPRI